MFSTGRDLDSPSSEALRVSEGQVKVKHRQSNGARWVRPPPAMDADLLHSALGSATAGIISRICTHPLDTAKAKLQSGGDVARAYRGPVDVLRKTIRTEGIRAWYRGFGAILVGGTPGTMVYLCSYEMIKKRLSGAISNNSSSTTTRASNDESFLVHFTAGMLAETISCIVYVPVDVIKERLQVQQKQQQNAGAAVTQQQYRGSYDALRKIMKNEGLKGIYKGYGATLLSFGPFSAIYFGLYESMKRRAREGLLSSHQQPSDDSTSILHVVRNSQDEQELELPFHWVVACSASAGAAASWLTSPLDMAKLRLQVQRGKAATGEGTQVMYRGMIDVLQFAFRDGGVMGLFKGALARVLHFTPATCITMTAYETCKSFYAKVLP